MRKPIAAILSILLMAMLAAPAVAAPDFTLKIGDTAYKGEFTVEDGVTMIPLGFIEKTLGAQTTVENDQIKIAKDHQVMLLTLNSAEANFNGRLETMPRAPFQRDQDYMAPLRYVLENFGAKVNWDADAYEISIAAPAANISAAEELLGKISEAMVKSNSFKMTADTAMNMDMTMEGETQHMAMSGTVNASIQQEPLLASITTAMKVDELTGTEEEIPADLLKSEMVMNEEGLFMTMPGVEGWVKLEMPGLDIQQLMKQYGSQDPVKSILQMKEFGAEITRADDQVIDGRNYGVLHIVMGQDSMGQYLNEVLGQAEGLLGLNPAGDSAAELETAMQELFNNMQASMAYDIVFDQETYLPLTMTLDMTMNLPINIPANEELETPAQSMEMKMTQKAAYKLYDYGVAFPVPVIEEYQTMEEMMAQAMDNLPEEAEPDLKPDLTGF